ncbi:glucuronate isomerase [Mucilaginibacter rubeus]|uniref:Uronate isomerase n=1 Tax=Mucilaginibacter rubeus TaxID=2027860 RepID=A0AAE6JEY5_9SPHI|nr:MULTISPECIES: glucuronate isomerase [Mucilaginibacter]QEM03840.1 glucuronate isomerase [Mucilaginibacter rubeus]QEM16450.1 glucuronate isomerase [Mucilaginibacter gossypii]QTE40782.1 glucuronate isomerase [Mucilaginibacter rubeus]QTE47384.1 glucuronate isomerase [Mucilaginibacter rubeus]QTE58778.1 glucuronate isomerase [Mucilaginibacter rubeus]
MKNFLDQDFLLQTKTAQRLYHEFASHQPIIDYHCHLPPDQIADDINFQNITQIWLYGDHYKWRAMRANGVNEAYITGNKTDEEKFTAWAATVPYTLRNPLYHWTHLELQRYFGITELLSPASAQKIYAQCNEKLQSPEFGIRNILKSKNVEVVGTTDDPLDNLSHHQKLKRDGYSVKVLPAYRPDKAMNADDIAGLNKYIDQLESVANVSISNIDEYLSALKARHDYFAENGCKLSDHGLEQIYAEDYTDAEIATIFTKIRNSEVLLPLEILKFKSAMLYYFAIWDHEKGWVQQFHLGALRNNNARALTNLGPDTGWDSIGDFAQGRALSKFLNRLDTTNQLAKTIIYNLNPADNELFATMVGNYNDGSVAGKMQFGSAWWFLDQKDGMIKQLNALSNMGLLSRLVGMLTDSRSFMSFPRHEYFRRLLCNLLGDDIENGELPNDIEWTGKIVSDICYFNAKNYFNF